MDTSNYNKFEELMAQLPYYYENDKFMTAYQKGVAGQWSIINGKIDEYLSGTQPHYAMLEVIQYFEKDYRIIPDDTVTLDSRRRRVIAKQFIRYNTYNEKNINLVSNLLLIGPVIVNFDTATGTIDVIIITDPSQPLENIVFFNELLNLWIPAHLIQGTGQVDFTWDELEAIGITWEQIEQIGYKWFTTPPTE